MDKIKIVVATRAGEQDFFEETATGRSLNLYRSTPIEMRVFFNNTQGLSKVYNQVIRESANDPSLLIFVHDDVHLLDYYWLQTIMDGLQHFQILGIAGSKRRLAGQSNWALIGPERAREDPQYLSGILGHGQEFPPARLDFFGMPGQQVKLLDGVMLCVASTTLVENNLYFDERFDFHFYDMDFCRQAESKSISCGTWPISIVHQSAGNAGSDAWMKAYRSYLAKWGS